MKTVVVDDKIYKYDAFHGELLDPKTGEVVRSNCIDPETTAVRKREEIYVMDVEKITLVDINESDYKPRRISEYEKIKLRKSIKRYGLVAPIIINVHDKTIISGHQRYNALIDLHIDELNTKKFNLIQQGDIGWVYDDKALTIKDDRHQKGLNLALNKIIGDHDYDCCPEDTSLKHLRMYTYIMFLNIIIKFLNIINTL